MLHESRQRGAMAELLVAYRFLEAGRLIAWPLVPCAYDLVVDGGDRLHRVQVKQAHEVGDTAGHWNVSLCTRRLREDKPLEVTAVDLLAIVTTPDAVFVVPADACRSPVDPRFVNKRLQIGPESHYHAYKNRFTIGPGKSAEATPAPIRPLHPAALWTPRLHKAHGSQRKRHRRLTAAQVAEIRALPVRWFAKQPGDGLIALDDVARQFDVCTGTLRNLILYGKRLDVSTALVHEKGD
jgi:hypothetical protein